ncbi:protease modulator HflC [Candidatus Parabeggiatoa sp. HSG14]|uniref:protease modulator HflC n=1 Tax=Candidatus Parabeggiatoa sp. HSG14 TaxID=3055593 RepID=UPI0032E425DE
MASKMMVGVMALIFLVVGLMSVFTVSEVELALKLRLGKVVSADFPPGLHFKLPFIHQIRTFDKRIQTLDAPPERFLTSEKKNLMVDSFVKWRIVNVVNYFTAVSGNTKLAKLRLAEIIADGLRSEFGKRTIKEVVSGDRAEIMDIITDEASTRSKKFGIKIVDVRIKRIELPREVSSSVYRRMEAERERYAKQLRSQGEATAVRIQAEADRGSVEVVSKAERDAEKIRGEGDAETTNTFALAFNQNPEFYVFYRTLNAYKEAFNNRGDILLIQPDSDFFSYFKQANGNTYMPSSSPASFSPKKETISEEQEKIKPITIETTGEITPKKPEKTDIPKVVEAIGNATSVEQEKTKPLIVDEGEKSENLD